MENGREGLSWISEEGLDWLMDINYRSSCGIEKSDNVGMHLNFWFLIQIQSQTATIIHKLFSAFSVATFTE